MGASKAGGLVQVNVVKQSNWKIPRQFIARWLESLARELKKQAAHDIRRQELTIAFVTPRAMQKLNRDFRSKNKVTDILSFSGVGEDSLGELVLCGERIDIQAHDHQLSRNEELGYMLIHGVLHLLGYDHERGGAQAKQMFSLQDRLFERLRQIHF